MSIFIRLIIVVLLAFFLSIILPALFRVLGIQLTADMIIVLRYSLAALAIFYIFFGRRFGWYV